MVKLIVSWILVGVLGVMAFVFWAETKEAEMKIGELEEVNKSSFYSATFFEILRYEKIYDYMIEEQADFEWTIPSNVLDSSVGFPVEFEEEEVISLNKLRGEFIDSLLYFAESESDEERAMYAENYRQQLDSYKEKVDSLAVEYGYCTYVEDSSACREKLR